MKALLCILALCATGCVGSRSYELYAADAEGRRVGLSAKFESGLRK